MSVSGFLQVNMSSKKKGDYSENKAKEYLEEAGWHVETPNSTPYPQPYGVDFFGLFDFMAFKDGEKPLFGQVKTNRPRGIRGFPEKCKKFEVPFEHVEVEYWTRYEGDGWRVDEVTEEGTETVLDERDSEGKMGEQVIELKS